MLETPNASEKTPTETDYRSVSVWAVFEDWNVPDSKEVKRVEAVCPNCGKRIFGETT